MSRLKLQGIPAVLMVCLMAVAIGCRAAEDKRTFQYLVSQGFGKTATGDANTENYIIVGDVVSIRDSLHTELTLPPQEVDVDGTISLPEIGQLLVKGMTRPQLEATLKEQFDQYYDRTDIRVQIQPNTSPSMGKKYFVVGEVSKMGAQSFRGDMTVLEAILEAQPKDETANLGRVQLIRGDPVDPLIIVVNFHDFIDYGDMTYNVIVRENDIIYVPPTFIGSLGNFVAKLFYPIKVIVQPLQSILFFFAVQSSGQNKVF